MGENGNDIILELKNITKYFPGVKALSNVNFTLRRGSVHAIVGENGAGKSTLMKVLSGVHSADEGEIILEGSEVDIQNQSHALALGISMIYQELNSVLDMTVCENIFLGQEKKSKAKLLLKKKMVNETNHILSELDIKASPNTLMRTLSVATRQMIEIAKAVSRECKILVMDEPTSSISQKEVDELFDFIKRLQKRGISVIYISHRLEELPIIADEITILRDGENIHSCRIDDITRDEMITYMVGRELSEIFPEKETAFSPGETIFEVSNFTQGNIFKNISFKVKSGEILGISGLVGAGRTEVVRAVCGLGESETGEVYLEGKKINIKSPSDAIDAGIAMISEDRKRYGLVLIRPVRENIILSSLKKFANKVMLIDGKKEKNEVQKQIDNLQIKVDTMERETSMLSGGNQQKVVIAKCMLVTPRVLIMDEPTRGIDVGAKYEIYKLMHSLAAQGIGIIMISSELPEILGMSDRILVMSDGEIKAEFSREDATQEKIMNVMAGGDIV